MAAAGDEKEGDDKDPDPVIVEKSAKAVVIHKISSLGDMCWDRERRSHYHIMPLCVYGYSILSKKAFFSRDDIL